MLILAIDTATPVAGVALVDEEKVIKEEFLNYKKKHSETLMPTIDRVLRECESSLTELEAIAVSTGPGSFTGLRIGMATAKGLSLASGKSLVGIPTLDVLACNVACTDALVCPLFNARKQELYAAFYDATGEFPRRVSELMACSPQDFVEYALNAAEETGRKRLILLGDGYYPYEDYFRDALGESLLKIPRHLMFPRASALGSLGVEKAKRKEFDNVFTIRPLYVRLSEAEYRLQRGEI